MRTFRAGLSALLIVSAGVTAEAHAFLDHAEPRVGSSVASAPRELSLWFTQNLEAAFSSIAVSDSNGARVDQGKPQIAGNVMHVTLKSLPQESTVCAGKCCPSIRIRRRAVSLFRSGSDVGCRLCWEANGRVV
jgi:copper resistance protein C